MIKQPNLPLTPLPTSGYLWTLTRGGTKKPSSPLSKGELKRDLKLLKRYFWHGFRALLVVLKLVIKHTLKWLNVHTKRRLIKWAHRIDRLDGRIGEDSLLIDILQYYGEMLLDVKGHVRWVKGEWGDFKKFIFPPKGSLSWKRVFSMSGRNLVQGKARVWVTMGGVSVGIGAIVLLVSFGFGLERVVTSRIIWPDALRVAEVTSESATVKITKETMAKILALKHVIKLAPSITMAGQVDFNGSKIDVVLTGVSTDYFKLSDLKMSLGTTFSGSADANYTGTALLEVPAFAKATSGEVAGASTLETIKVGDSVATAVKNFRLRDETYVPVFEKPKSTAKVLGYARGSYLDHFQGMWVWGGVYESVSGQGRVVNPDGTLMGKWLVASFPLYEDIGGGVFQSKKGEKGQQVVTGFVTDKDASLLSDVEVQVAQMGEVASEGFVLGEATASAAEAPVQVGPASAVLLQAINQTNQVAQQAATPSGQVIKVRNDNPKEILVSSSLIKAWNKKESEIIGKTVSLNYLVTSSLLPGLSGRLLSEKVEYRIVGVFDDVGKPMAFVPLGDMESLGIKYYSAVKVMSSDQTTLTEVRTLIQSLGLVTRSVADTLSQIVKLFSIIRFLLGSFGAIALVVALFGMFNTLTVSLLERTREIGVMKSLGTTNSDVSRIFLTESVLISASGGLGGVVLGSVLGKVMDLTFFAAVHSTDQSLFVMPLSFGLFIFMLAVLVGMVTGWYPAKRASKISALNALRYE